MFVKYANLSGNSNVSAFEIGTDYISVIFNNTQKPYVYSYRSAGQFNVEHMKKLALSGCGLNSFILRYCKYSYE